ncbi:MAG TPA: hypothetical protein VGO96_07765 [Pyrinomonadaceae bacterium]|nr:hypothetical protein [Pyrinomonadaceae bacterium]
MSTGKQTKMRFFKTIGGALKALPRKAWSLVKKSFLYVFIAVFVVGSSLVICRWVNSNEMVENSRKAADATKSPEHQQKEEDKRKESWEEYKIHVDLFKYYLDLVLRTNLAVFAITGGILTFYFKNREENAHMKKALLLPFFVSLALAGFYFYCACLWLNISGTVNSLRENLGIIATPYVHILSVLLFLFGIVFLGVGEALLWFMRTDKPRAPTAQSPAG